jgi:carbon-monoxide dehydrogenase iron sulfur subunit
MPESKRYFIKVKASNCSGCRTCELVCSEIHDGGVINPKQARIQVDVEHRNNVNKPRVCIQCEDQFCLKTCPEEAIKLDPELDIPVVDSEMCTGCRECVDACVYGFVFFNEIKCDLCGGEPECVSSCTVNALVYHKVE